MAAGDREALAGLRQGEGAAHKVRQGSERPDGVRRVPGAVHRARGCQPQPRVGRRRFGEAQEAQNRPGQD